MTDFVDLGVRLREIHQLKTLPPFFDHVLSGKKTFEVRKDDRGFHHDDILDLREWTGEAYTGRRICKRVCYLLSGDAFGVAKDHVVMGLADIPDWADGDYGDYAIAVVESYRNPSPARSCANAVGESPTPLGQ